MTKKKQNKLIILSGPSGVGKNTIIEKLLEILNSEEKKIIYSVSYTTRSKRPNEINKINYNFISDKKFKKMIKKNDFLEHAIYSNNFYGTGKEWINKNIKKFHIIAEIDVQGFLNIKKIYSDLIPIISFFILPPSRKELKKRIISRNLNQKKDIEKRLAIYDWEEKNKNEYKYLIINRDLDTTINKILEIFKSESIS